MTVAVEVSIPEAVTVASSVGEPAWPVTPTMEALADRALLPDTTGETWSTGCRGGNVSRLSKYNGPGTVSALDRRCLSFPDAE